MSPPTRASIVCLVGPTAVGKTSVSLKLADRLQAEIVSMDSRLLYRSMDIGTAKPTQEERDAIPHHLLDVADPGETWSLANYRKALMAVIDDLACAWDAAAPGRGNRPILQITGRGLGAANDEGV